MPSNRSERMRHQRPGRHAEGSASLTRAATMTSATSEPSSQTGARRRRPAVGAGLGALMGKLSKTSIDI